MSVGWVASNLFSPSQFDQLSFWLPNPDSLGLGSGSLCATWSDWSGFGRDAIQGTVGRQPVYYPRMRNGHGALFFNANNLRYPGLVITPQNDFTLYVVANAINVSGSSGTMFAQREDTGQDLYPSMGILGSPWHSVSYYRDGALTNNASSTDDRGWHIFTVSVASLVSTLWVDNVSMGTAAVNTGIISSNYTLIGGSDVGAHGSVDLYGFMAEVIVYTQAHDAAHRDRINGWLGSRYAISV